MRFEDRIHVEVNGLPAEAENILVPKFILQLLVENCYHYGVKNKLEGGLIRVGFTLEGGWLSICVEDNGDEITPQRLAEIQRGVQSSDEAAKSHALANIRRRLELAYGQPDLLRLSISGMGGLAVTLRFETAKKPAV